MGQGYDDSREDGDQVGGRGCGDAGGGGLQRRWWLGPVGVDDRSLVGRSATAKRRGRARRANTAEVVAAATASLETLNPTQMAKVVYDFSNNTARQTWSNFPAMVVPRSGMGMSD
jgi:hypothetical protein